MNRIFDTLDKIVMTPVLAPSQAISVQQIAVGIIALAALAILVKYFYKYVIKNMGNRGRAIVALTLLALAEIARRNFNAAKVNKLATHCKSYLFSKTGLKKDLVRLVQNARSRLSKVPSNEVITNFAMNSEPIDKLYPVLYMSKL